jgi:hypothetical protein
MNRNPSLKLDALRAMREARYEQWQKQRRPDLARLRAETAAIPVKKAKKPKRPRART